MKTILKNTIIISLVIMAVASATSCKKDTTTPAPAAPAATGLLAFHLHTNIDSTEADSGSVVLDHVTGMQYKLSLAQFYISGIKLKKSDGTYYTVNNVYILKNIVNEDYTVGNVPAGNYLSVSFNIGIDDATNQTNPASYDKTSSLSVQNPSMWFGSTSQGYIFLNLQGYVDTSAGNTGSYVPFSYQLGTSSMLKAVTLPDQAFTISPGTTPTFVHMIADYGKLLEAVTTVFKAKNTSMYTATPWSNASVATQIADSIPKMFRYEY